MSGPEGIRTPDLLSAIEARSQLRYRPSIQSGMIVSECRIAVKLELISGEDANSISATLR